MRIISGKLRGTPVVAPRELPVRPTTDKAKEALFNILVNRMTIEGAYCLDLFAGTGGITFELASRSAQTILAVDKNPKCCRFIEQFAARHRLEKVDVLLSDVFRFLEHEVMTFDFIFADPPYDMPNRQKLPEIIFERNLLRENGLFVFEHSSLVELGMVKNLREKRVYGSSAFSFFDA